MKKFIKIAPLIFLLTISICTHSQNRGSHEIGLIFGSASFTTDYGQRNHFMSNVGGNVGAGIGIIYYYNFTDYRYLWNQRTTYWAQHFRLRGELSYMSAKLDHFGKWVDPSRQSLGADQLRAMHGKTYLVNVGAQLEYHWVDIVDFGTRVIPDLNWSPYLSAGFFVDYYNPSLKSDMGDWTQNPSFIHPKWAVDGATNMEANVTGSVTLGVGTRRRLGPFSDLMIESRWQYFFSNFVDGLNAREDPDNKFNDWLLWIHVGFVYYLN